MTAAIRKPTAADAAKVREVAKEMGYNIRVARKNWSLRLIGATGQVRDVAVALDLRTASFVAAWAPRAVPDYNGQTEFFAYVPA